MNSLPNRIFFTGVPGSRWSGVAQQLETLPGFNTTDRSPQRQYSHSEFSGHVGSYFGVGMEFEPLLNDDHLDSPYKDPAAGCKIIKSHDWAYDLDTVYMYAHEMGDKLMIVWRDPKESYEWWHEAGGFNITYPNYEWYRDSDNMKNEIIKQNSSIIEFITKRGLYLEEFDNHFVEKHFGIQADIKPVKGVSVCLV